MSESSDLSALVQRLAGVRVLVVGDVMLDRFISGVVERISPEAPIPILRVEREAAMLGGAGNVVRNLAALGAAPAFVAVVGDDLAGREVQRLVAEVAGADGHLLLDRARGSTIKERYLASGQQLLRVDRDSRQQLSSGLSAAVVQAAVAALATADALVLSDYGKGVLLPETLTPLIAAARARGLPIVVDPKAKDFRCYSGVSVVTPNRRELAGATGMTVAGDREVEAAARHLIASCGLGAVLATRSEAGMTLVTAQSVEHLAAEAREVFDVSGAGDTVVAALAAALAAGLPLGSAARLANAAAGVVVGKVGTAVVHPDELRHALHAQEFLGADAKVMGLGPLVDQVARWRRAGLKVGFTNGCFDLLHPGHVTLLAKARAACDRLIVGLNSDASVKRLKGESRPVQNEVARATVLASLASVDAVVIYGEDTPLETLEALRPDLLVKGADYRLDQVVGAELLQSYGGQVLLVPLEAGHSTTGTIQRMAR